MSTAVAHAMIRFHLRVYALHGLHCEWHLSYRLDAPS